MGKRNLFSRAMAFAAAAMLAAALVPALAFAGSDTNLVAAPTQGSGVSQDLGPTPVAAISDAIANVLKEYEESGTVLGNVPDRAASTNSSTADVTQGGAAAATGDAGQQSSANAAQEGQPGAAEDQASSGDSADPTSNQQDGGSAQEESSLETQVDDSGEGAASAGSESASGESSEEGTDAQTGGEESGSLMDAQADEGQSDSSADTQAEGDSQSSTVDTQASDDEYADNTLTWKTDPSSVASGWYSSSEVESDHGTAELISVVVDGSTVSASDLAKNTTSDSAYYKDGTLCAPAGSLVTMKLLPNRGYQLTSDTLSGGSIPATASDDENQIGVYTLEMPTGGEALTCDYAEFDDAVDTEGTNAFVSGSLSGGETIIENGTLRLSIVDLDDTESEQGLISAAKKLGASDSSIVALVDMTMASVICQGNPDLSWETVLTDLSSAVSVSLVLSDEAASGASSFYIVREHDGSYQQATVEYDSDSKTITFPTSAFSDYALVKGTPSSNNNSSNNSSSSGATSSTGTSSTKTTGSTTPSTGDGNDTAPFAVLAGASALTCLVSLRRISYWSN